MHTVKVPTAKEIKEALRKILPGSDDLDDIDALQRELEDQLDVGDLQPQRKLIEREVKAYQQAAAAAAKAKMEEEEEASGKELVGEVCLCCNGRHE